MLIDNISRLSLDSFTIILILSSFLGVSVSYGDFYLYHFVLSVYIIAKCYIFKEKHFQLNLNTNSKNYLKISSLIFIWYIFSLSWTPNLILGLKYIFYILCGLIVMMSTISYSSSLNRLNKLFYFLGIFFTIELIIALFESFTSFRMPISSYSPIASYFGKDPINYSELGNILSFTSFTPPTGFRWNTNDLSICMIIAFPFFLCSKNKKNKLIGIIAITTIIVMTASRAVFMGLLLIYTLYLLMIKKKIGTLIIVWISIAFFIFGMIQFRESNNPRINELANTFEALTLYITGNIDVTGSLEWRRILAENGLIGLSQSNGFGLGAGGSVGNQEIIGAVDGRFTSMHNFWLELLVEGGYFIGLTIFLSYVLIIIKLYIISRSSTIKDIKYFSESLFLSMTAFIPSAIAASSTIYFFPMWIMFGFSLSTISLNKTKNN